MVERVLLVGMMGSGKTTVGRRLADRLGWDFLDSDDQVCRNTGRTVREIFESDGEAAFRAEERKALAQATESDRPSVVAVAGGAVLDPENRRRIKEAGTVIWLDAAPEVLALRVGAADHRPLLGSDPEAALRRLDRERRPVYAELADLKFDAGRSSAESLVEQILEAVR